MHACMHAHTHTQHAHTHTHTMASKYKLMAGLDIKVTFEKLLYKTKFLQERPHADFPKLLHNVFTKFKIDTVRRENVKLNILIMALVC